MRTKRTRPVQTRTKVHILTGGIKEDVSQLELKGGELLIGENIQEIDGVYHGYSSLPGYEVAWGSQLPSEIEVPLVAEAGLTNDVVLLLSTYEGTIKDLSSVPKTLTINPAVVVDTTLSKFPTGAISLPSPGIAISVANHAGLNLADEDWEVDFVVKGVTTGEMLNLGGGLVIGISGGLVYVSLGLNGAVAGVTPAIVTVKTVDPLKNVHVAVNRVGQVIRVAINGIVDSSTHTLAAPTDYLTYSGASPILLAPGRIEEFRISKGAPKWIQDFTPTEVPYADPYFVPSSQYNDLEREAVRSAVEPVGGTEGVGPVRAVSVFQDEYFAVRDFGTATGVYPKSLHPARSSNIGPTGYNEFPLGGTYQFARGTFFAFGDVVDSFQSYIRKEVLFLATGVTPPVWFDGKNYRQIDHPGLPDNDSTDSEFAVSARVFKDRLFLGYPSGKVVFSAAGDPLNFSVVEGAGFFYLPAGVTDLISAPGDALIMFTLGSINVAKTLADAGISNTEATFAYKFFNEDFSQASGCFRNTAQRIMGMIIFMDDRGVSSLEATDAFGDFNAGSLSRNVQKTLLKKKKHITCSTVFRENNQYRLFFDDKTGFILTFDSEKKVKGITSLKYKVPVLCVDTQKNSDGDEVTIFGSSDGFVYLMDSGTSFNGLDIETKLCTAFYNYGSPAYRKRFRKVTLESSAPRGLIFYGKLEFDYRSSYIPRGITEELESLGSGGVYGQDVYGKFTYGSTAVETPTLYDDGYGENMSVTITTKDRYRTPHTINSYIVEFVVVNRIHA